MSSTHSKDAAQLSEKSWDVESGEGKPVYVGVKGKCKKFIDGFKPADEFSASGNAFDSAEKVPLKRALKARHLSMLAIGGSIGSGLFIGSGSAMAKGGPAGVVLSFGVVGILLFVVMQCLGELTVRFPISGAFYTYSQRFISRSWGFALGWNYLLLWGVCLPLELVASSVILDFWSADNNAATNVNKAAWVALFYGLMVFINIFGARGFGEAEFVMSFIKIITVLGFCIFGIVAAAGGAGNHKHFGSTYWHHPGAFAGGFKGICACFVNAAFSFSGSEMAGLAASETDNPAKHLPRAVKQVFWRIMFFYVVSLTIVGFLVPYDDPRLGNHSDGRSSPFVLAIANTGTKALPSIVNVVILIAALSVANTSVYATSRTLTSLAVEGQAPKLFTYVDREGRPLYSVIAVLIFGLLGFLVASDKQSEVFNWLLAFSGLAVIITYTSICFALYRFRQGMKAQGMSLDELAFTAAGGKWAALLGAIGSIVIIGLQFWVALFPMGEGHADAESFFQVFLGLPVVLVMYFGHKIWTKAPWWIKAEEMDLVTGSDDPALEEKRLAAIQYKAELKNRSWAVRVFNFWC